MLTLSWWKVSSRKLLSLGVSSTKKAAAFSSRYFSRLVPGMGNTSSPCSAGLLRLNTLALLLEIAQADVHPSQHLGAAHQVGTLGNHMVVWASKTAIEQRRHYLCMHPCQRQLAGRAALPVCQHLDAVDQLQILLERLLLVTWPDRSPIILPEAHSLCGAGVQSIFGLQRM